MTQTETISLEDQIKKLALEEGAALVGICSAESIKDKEFSDPNYLLSGAKSVISIAINFDDEKVRKYLSKEEYLPLCYEEGYTTKNLKKIAEKIKLFLEEKGFEAYNCDCNYDYRNINRTSKAVVSSIKTLVDLINKENDKDYNLTKKETITLKLLKKLILPGLKKTPMRLIPSLSHRCVAVSAGVGRIGWSGNLITEKYGARVLLNSIITNANLKPDKPLENNPCTKCKICEKSCQGGLFSKDEEQTINIAGVEETIAKRNSYAYCIAICSSMSGQNKFKEWSTWSPFRFDDIESLPLDDSVDNYVKNMFAKGIEKGGEQAENVLRLVTNTYLGRNDKPAEDFRPTCGFCQMVCSGLDSKKTKESYKLIVNSGCIEKD
ncbi:MAG: epoxyqueuosine reductase [Candidatus Lokiarchaeota archaeon]|nr:epoxyqueuosine reductase [Candidatus Lokiarchaeota archaeon]